MTDNSKENINENAGIILDELREDCARKQKKGAHFIIASILLWTALLIVQCSGLPVLTRNLYTFCCTGMLVPLAYIISKGIGVDFQNKGNPLNGLGLLFSINQLFYLLIAMWIYQAVPEKMVMVLAMIFGAHLFPYGWLYKSFAYRMFAVVIPIGALILGNMYPSWVLCAVMIPTEIFFSLILLVECRKYSTNKNKKLN